MPERGGWVDGLARALMGASPRRGVLAAVATLLGLWASVADPLGEVAAAPSSPAKRLQTASLR